VTMEATGKYSLELAVWLLEQQPSREPVAYEPSISGLGEMCRVYPLQHRCLFTSTLCCTPIDVCDIVSGDVSV